MLPKPEGLLSGVVFFADEADVLALVATREHVLMRARSSFSIKESLNFLREKYPTIPSEAVGAIFFEQETNEATEEIGAERVDGAVGPASRLRLIRGLRQTNRTRQVA